MTDISDEKRKLYRKYLVERLNDLEGKHNQCFYFVLDLDHDPHALVALRAYAASVRDECPMLADNLEEICNTKASQSPQS